MSELDDKEIEDEDKTAANNSVFTPGELLIRDLESLRSLLNQLHDKLNASGVERTFHLRRIMGKDCTYLKKSMNLFVDEDFEPLRNLIAEVNDRFLLIDGKK